MLQRMKKARIYLDTSVVSYLEQTDAPERMQLTRDVWETLKSDKYDIYISNVVVRELSKCSDENKRSLLLSHLEEIQYTMVNVTDEIFAFAEKIVDFGILKERSFDDCQHIAAAVVSDCDVIMSWNFKHLVNFDTIEGIRILTTMEGYKNIIIYSPESFQTAEGEENE